MKDDLQRIKSVLGTSKIILPLREFIRGGEISGALQELGLRLDQAIRTFQVSEVEFPPDAAR